tara:strand:+ start:484 stop:771 length:288 start_codon:yes stop_codon:yes gene_type:complete
VQNLRRDLAECKKRGQKKDKRIKELDKKVFVLTIVAIIIGAILGKEMLQSLVEWIDSINAFRGGIGGLTLNLPSPGTLPIMALAMLPVRGRRRRR